jgi:hypothetical protein
MEVLRKKSVFGFFVCVDFWVVTRLLCITAQDDGGTGGLESAKQRDEKRGTELCPWRGFELALPAEQGRER